MFDHLPPMFPPMIPTCQIQWIDDKGNPTPDDHPAIGLAMLEHAKAHDRRYLTSAQSGFPICAHHLERMPQGWSFYLGNRVTRWTFSPYQTEGTER